MKLDMDLVRKCLLDVENLKPYEERLILDNETLEVCEHLELLHEASFIDANINKYTNGKPYGAVFRLTWEGHQFLETIRNEENWKKTKSILEKVGSFSVEIIKTVAVGLIKEQIKL